MSLPTQKGCSHKALNQELISLLRPNIVAVRLRPSLSNRPCVSQEEEEEARMRLARWNKDNAFSSVLSGPGCGTCHLFPGAVAFLSACLWRRWDKPPRLRARRIVSHTGPGLHAFSDYDLKAAITRTVLFLE